MVLWASAGCALCLSLSAAVSSQYETVPETSGSSTPKMELAARPQPKAAHARWNSAESRLRGHVAAGAHVLGVSVVGGLYAGWTLAGGQAEDRGGRARGGGGGGGGGGASGHLPELSPSCFAKSWMTAGSPCLMLRLRSIHKKTSTVERRLSPS